MAKRLTLLLVFMSLLSAADELSACLGVNNICDNNIKEKRCCEGNYPMGGKIKKLMCLFNGDDSICTFVDAK